MKKLWQVCKTIAIYLFGLLLLVSINEMLDFLLTDDTESYTRIMMKEMYEQESIDALFLGSSHCYRSIDTSIMDESWDMNTFNAGTSSQVPSATYYLLREAVKEHKPSKIYMEVYYEMLSDKMEYQTPTAVYIISDYMKSLVNRFLFLWDTGGKDYLVHGLIPGRRYWDKLFQPEYIRNLWKKKTDKRYSSYEYIKAGNEAYAGKGFVDNWDVIEEGTFSKEGLFKPISPENITAESKEYLDKIIDLCKKNDIELIFYSAPFPDFRLAGVENYDSYIRQMKEFLKGKDIPYYDFNLCRSEYLKLGDECFKDDDHLNGTGARMFSKIFAEFFQGNIKEEELFWDSYKQKSEMEEEQVYGVICEFEEVDEETTKVKIHSVDNVSEDVYYAVYKRKETETDYQLYRDYSKETEFILPEGESGYFHVYVSLDEEGSQVTNDATFYYNN